MIFPVIILAIAMQVFLTAKKVSPFLSLLIVAVITGFLLGMQPQAILAAIEKGVGGTLGGLVLIICLGAVLGKILEESGAAEQIAATLIAGFGQKNVQWAMMLTGFLVGIPLYYNAGFIILVPLVFTTARKAGFPLLHVAVSMAAALSTTHCFLPPHPGPALLVNTFKANTGKTLLYGLTMAIPAVIIAGPLLGRMLRNIKPVSATLFSTDKPRTKALPPVTASFMIALLPVLLITAAVAVNHFLPANNILKNIILFLGDTNIALLLAVILGGWYFGLRTGVSMTVVTKWVHDGVAGVAVILLIITAGGVLKQILVDSGTATYIASFSSKWHMHPLLFAWIVTALLRVTIGSATVAGITAAGVVSPLLVAGNVSPELLVLAVGAGSVFGSHVNDSGFWMFKEFFGLSLKQTFLSWSVMETAISVIGLAGVMVINSFVQ